MSDYCVPWQGSLLYEREEEYIPTTTAVFDKRNQNSDALESFRLNIQRSIEVYNRALHWTLKQVLYTWDGEKYNFKGLKKKIQRRYNLKSRVADTLISDVQGILKSQRELKGTELEGINLKIESLEEEIAELKEKKQELHQKTNWFKPTTGTVKQYRNLKTKLAAKKRALDRKKCSRAKLERQLESGVFSICFGSKMLFRQRNNTDHPNNPFSSTEEWKQEWHYQRNKTYKSTGTGKEKYSNSMVQLVPDHQSNFFIVRVSSPFADENRRFFEYPVEIRYLNKELKEAQRLQRPFTVVIKEENGRLYLKVTIHKKLEASSFIAPKGALGLDYNDGFITAAWIDKKGNLMATKNIAIPNQLSSEKNQTIMEQKIVAIHKYAKEHEIC